MDAMVSGAEAAAIHLVTQRLSSKFPDVELGLVRRVVRETQQRFDTHPTRDVVPVLVEDVAGDRLRYLSASRLP